MTEPGYYTYVLDGPDCDSVIGLTLMMLETLEEDPETALQVWPNPTKGLLHIEAVNYSKAEVRNLLGQRIMEFENTKTLNLEGFRNGIYFLIVNDNNGLIHVTKIIKE